MNPLWLLALLAIGLSGIIGLEFNLQPRDEDAMPQRQPRPATLAPSAATLSGGADPAALAAILARPLFAPDRRPAAATAEVAAGRAAPPRVTGILIDGGRRSVIFAGEEGRRPAVVGVGGEVDGFRVVAIEAERVTVSGPDGQRTLRPSFDPRPPSPGSVASSLSQPGVSQSGVSMTPVPPNPAGIFAAPAPPAAR